MAVADSISTAGERVDLVRLSRAELAAALGPWIDRPFRVAQVYDALHLRGVAGWEEMTELPKELRGRLAERFAIGWPEIVARRPARDTTCKVLLRLADGATIEAVDIPDRDRRTLCLSSQAGCALACTFCVTGYWGAGRNLAAGEIVAQVRAVQRDRGHASERLNLVFMGMGEPLLNREALREALEVLGRSISLRRITVSTAGVVPGIDDMAGWERRPNLAVSLHAPDDARRSALMALNRTHPLRDLLAALRRYPLESGRRLTFEYLLVRDFNDAPADADAVARLIGGFRAKVNLIPMNPDPVLDPALVPPSPERVEAFRDRLRARGLVATVRRRRGEDVSAACGQLRAFGRDARGFRRATSS
jgi:23S rRNA (adenine2503-C2)-methyltransferase